jgi:hypothetical protein
VWGRRAAQHAAAERSRGTLILAGLGLSALALALAPLLMPASYSWIANTTSESAAQGVHGAWLARLGFLLFGLSVLALAGPARPRWGSLAVALHCVFGAGLIAAAAFSARPWTGQPFDTTEDALHSVTASVVGIAFGLGVIATMIHRGVRALDVVAVGAAVVIPLVMLLAAGVDGAVQRLMFAIAYVWYGVIAIRLVVPET